MLSTLRVVEGAIVVVSGVMGVEVGTERLWNRCDELGLPRLVLVNMLDRERADFFAALEALRRPALRPLRGGRDPDRPGARVPRRRRPGPHGRLPDHGGDGCGHDEPSRSPKTCGPCADEYHDKLMDVVAETSDELMESYLEGDEITREEMAAALKKLVTEGELFPVGCGAATRNIGTHGLLDLIVEGLPSPRAGAQRARGRAARRHARVRVQDDRRPVQRQDQPAARVRRRRSRPTRTWSTTTRTRKERIGQLLRLQGKEHDAGRRARPGRDRRGRQAQGDGHRRRALRRRLSRSRSSRWPFPAPVVSFAIEPQHKGDEDKVHPSLRRLQEEDPSLDVHRDPQTGETIVAGLSQMHVEVTLERVARRFGVEVDLHPPRVPYLETIRKPRAGPGPLQEADRRPRPVRRLPHRSSSRWRATRATSSWTRSSAA